jgi:transcription elongation factor Elf1
MNNGSAESNWKRIGKLLPCPFCGHKVSLSSRINGICCARCGVLFPRRSNSGILTWEAVARLWNRRAERQMRVNTKEMVHQDSCRNRSGGEE